jgi:hypothetical protein
MVSDYKGATEKVSKFKKLLKSVYNKNVCFNDHKSIFEHCRKLITIFKITLFLFLKIVLLTASEVPSIGLFLI